MDGKGEERQHNGKKEIGKEGGGSGGVEEEKGERGREEKRREGDGSDVRRETEHWRRK